MRPATVWLSTSYLRLSLPTFSAQGLSLHLDVRKGYDNGWEPRQRCRATFIWGMSGDTDDREVGRRIRAESNGNYQVSDLPSQLQSSHNAESPPSRKKIFRFWRCFWLTFLVASLAYAWYSFYVPPNGVAWAGSYTVAQQQAADSGKPIILYFTANWCVPCRIMKRQVWADDQVTALVNAQFIPVAIDVDSPDNASVLARYNVKGTPVTIIADPQGNALRWRVGGIGKSEFLELLSASNPS